MTTDQDVIRIMRHDAPTPARSGAAGCSAIPFCRDLQAMTRHALEEYAFGLELSMRTLAKLTDALVEECRDKHLLDPFEDGLNLDYHAEVTLTIREIRDAVQAVRQNVANLPRSEAE